VIVRVDFGMMAQRGRGRPGTLDFRRIIGLWPSIPDCATSLNLSVATVRSWVQRDRIPLTRWDQLIAAARRSGIVGVSEDSLLAAARIANAEKAQQRGSPATDKRRSG
jgi:hypothetical protein